MPEFNVKLKADVAGVLKRFGVLDEGLARALSGGLAEATDHAASQVVLQAGEDGIQSRSGALLSAVRGAPDFEGALAGQVGVPREHPAARYAWLLTDEDKRITPKRGKYLTIPIGLNLTGAGLARYPSVAAMAAEFGEDAVEWRGRTVGIRTGPESYEPMFALATEVLVFGRGSLPEGVEAAKPDMNAIIQEHVDALIAS